MWAIKVQINYPETDKSGQFWRSTMLDMNSRLRVARGIAKTETDASVIVFETLKERGHPDKPPPTLSDGWGGIREAMVEVYGIVPLIQAMVDHQHVNNQELIGSIYKWSRFGTNRVGC